MFLNGVSSTTPSAGPQATQDRKQLDEDLNKFLTLLVTQLQHQDPLEPLDAHEFTAQLVQFASVEQQIQQSGHLETLIAQQNVAQATSAASWLGKTVEAQGTSLPLIDGQARASYTLAEPAADTTITIKDAQGRVVYSADSSGKPGRNVFEWDGTTTSGSRLADGGYTLQVDARRRDGSPIEATTTVFGLVTAASFADGTSRLHLGDLELPLDRILSVRAAPVPLASTTPAP
jgi:flagellar basal-body rod modification protein FlgD